jgi:hypothetical protein
MLEIVGAEGSPKCNELRLRICQKTWNSFCAPLVPNQRDHIPGAKAQFEAVLDVRDKSRTYLRDENNGVFAK